MSEYERGLLGVAFPRNYTQKKYFYAFYNRVPDGFLVLSRFTVTGNPNRADKLTEDRLLIIEHGVPWNNGGHIAFGPDGFLYISIGDGTSPESAQSSGSLLGKLLRVDVESGVLPYGVPETNPFVAQNGYRPEIWALGFHNPSHFSFDQQTGDLYVGDKGFQSLEEIDFQPGGTSGGRNYGWPVYEGNLKGYFANSIVVSNAIPPIAVYSHEGTWDAQVIGGLVVRNQALDRLNGVYIFGDFNSGRVFGLAYDGIWNMQVLASSGFAMSTFGDDETGHLYVADYGGGNIYRVDDSGRAAQPTFDPAGPYAYSEMTRVASITPGSTIHYTTNGRIPGATDPAVPSDGRIPSNRGQQILARAFRDDLEPSFVTSNLYTTLQVAPIDFSPVPGSVGYGTEVTVSTRTPGAMVFCSLFPDSCCDYSSALSNCAGCSVTFIVTNHVWLFAQAFKDGYLPCEVEAAEFDLPTLSPPEFQPAGSPITNGTLVTITSPDPDATIHYILNGSTVPDVNSPVYSGPIRVSPGDRLLATALKDGWNPSALKDVLYKNETIFVSYDPPLGPIPKGSSVRLTASSPDAVIHFSLDGSYASPTSPIYTGPIVVNDNTWISGAGIKKDTGYVVFAKTYGLVINDGSTRVETFAGSGIADFVDGPAEVAEFSGPTGLCLDRAGNIYVADTGNHRVRTISPKGRVTSLAGNGVPGLRDGPARSAQFSTIIGICRDLQGNVYVSDSGNQVIRRIAHHGTVSTYARTGTPLSYLDADSEGILYVGVPGGVFKILRDHSVEGFGFLPAEEVGIAITAAASEAILVGRGNPVFRVPRNGTQVQLTYPEPYWAYDGPVTSSAFPEARDAATDRFGNVYVTDGNRIRKISSDGRVTTLAGTGAAGYRDGVGAEAQFDHPAGLCVDTEGNVYVADKGNQRIRRIVQTMFGQNCMTDSGGAQAGKTNPLPGLRIHRVEGGTRIEFNRSAPPKVGERYQLQASDDLVTWEDLGAPVQGADQILFFSKTIHDPNDSVRFFRVIVR